MYSLEPEWQQPPMSIDTVRGNIHRRAPIVLCMSSSVQSIIVSIVQVVCLLELGASWDFGHPNAPLPGDISPPVLSFVSQWIALGFSATLTPTIPNIRFLFVLSLVLETCVGCWRRHPFSRASRIYARETGVSRRSE